MPYSEPSALLSAALATAARGWPVFPLHPGDKRPAITAWEQRATTEPGRIERCWKHAPYNIGVATGPAGLLVVDLDTPKDADDAPPAGWAERGVTEGADVLAVLCERHGKPYPADTYTVCTGRGGTHLYFTAPDDATFRNTAGDSARGLGWKVDTRASGGYVVGGGSVVNSRPYTAVYGSVAAPLPVWLADLLTPPPLPPQRPVAVALDAADRHGKWLHAAVEGELARVTTAAPGGRNNALYIASVALGQLVAGGELTEPDVTGWLADAARQVGQGEGEAQRTIASGLRTGARRPRQVAA
ncbi:bifunctional DNA primase/polymerase [Streptomyces sp. NPDC087422]|uniref:bifunctional DNA primase/polymerase n=1 Tax=Streptomyces sp. NPDC087422 TaxID=3365786 RepID=UPI0038059B03